MQTPTALVARRDIPLALGLLTRLPVPVDAGFAQARGAGAAWAYPLAGLAAAMIAGGIGWGAAALGLPAGVAAGLALTAQIVLTGAMHEDGLADAADGLWGGWSRERRLEIMKDSRMGAYGTLALILSVGLRWAALAALDPAMLLPAMVAAALLSRAVMVGVMAALPNARDGGLSRGIGRPRTATAVLAAMLALGLSVAVAGPAALALALVAVAAAAGSAAIARAKIGGQTGDILGATQQMAEIACLTLATALPG
ncbi:adenosylcobinamide-GDP ribazoletransferase [Tropicimonas sp. IMCC34043]|uniref:adenosylcobinamide-GDP ribazoletransferase n=1 Tax=Tropicimonas sp. IMCC34043 TaxID=2248760 RepID=UPI000E2408FC|nr:adenosylcobinamide-GDP ribazoletransferase [Tropicimonas sp. IMCC34043]